MAQILPIVDVKTFLGPMAVGSVLSGVVFGCAVVQTYSYYKRFPDDSEYIKALVIFEMTLQTVHLVLMLAGLWHMVVTDYGNSLALLFFPETINVTLILCSPLAFASQAYFIFRLWRLSQNLILVGFCLSLAVARFAFHMVVGIAAYLIRDILSVVQQWKWCITTMFVMSIACDTIVAVAVAYILRDQKTGFRRTSWIIDKLISYSVATGLVTIAFELGQALCFWTMPRNYVWLGFYAIESGLYTNSLLAALNGRSVFNQLWAPQPSSDPGTLPRSPQLNVGDKGPYFSIHSDGERSVGLKELPVKAVF
ncbi:hypothetical protein BKA82DRAFT_4171333 [Pisolithus tinctorius]|nr:hypothetical protein BKA82DRAFT_4171333 [Pisolithus tinctorius]